MEIQVTKLTDENLIKKACEMTFLGKSNQSLSSMYRSEHSPVRTQLFWIEMTNIPLFSSSHFIRHHVGSVPYQLTCRDDRKGGNVGFPERVEGVQNDVSNLMSLLENGSAGNASESLYESIQDDLEFLKTNADRLTPVNLGILINAQSLIDMAKLRLCLQAHKTTIKIFKALKEKIREVDPDLAEMMVVKCVYRNGLCGEPKCCGYNQTRQFKNELHQYSAHFDH